MFHVGNIESHSEAAGKYYGWYEPGWIPERLGTFPPDRLLPGVGAEGDGTAGNHPDPVRRPLRSEHEYPALTEGCRSRDPVSGAEAEEGGQGGGVRRLDGGWAEPADRP
jgi:hypothetical protein